MARFQQVSSVRDILKVGWQCQFDSEILSYHPELKQHPIVQRCPLKARDALYGSRTEAIILHYAAREGEAIR